MCGYFEATPERSLGTFQAYMSFRFRCFHWNKEIMTELHKVKGSHVALVVAVEAQGDNGPTA